MSVILWLLVAILIIGCALIIAGACWASRPAEWERRLEDDEQLEYLRKYQAQRKRQWAAQ